MDDNRPEEIAKNKRSSISKHLQNAKVGHQRYGRINWIKCKNWSCKKTEKRKTLVKVEGFQGASLAVLCEI